MESHKNVDIEQLQPRSSYRTTKSNERAISPFRGPFDAVYQDAVVATRTLRGNLLGARAIGMFPLCGGFTFLRAVQMLLLRGVALRSRYGVARIRSWHTIYELYNVQSAILLQFSGHRSQTDYHYDRQVLHRHRGPDDHLSRVQNPTSRSLCPRVHLTIRGG